MLGINDYFSIEGYRRVREAWLKGRLPNIRLLLPIVELRLTTFAGNSETQKVNFHVVFSDTVTADEIEQSFLRGLIVTLNLDGARKPWSGCLGLQSGMESLGSHVRDSIPTGKRGKQSDIRVGFASAAVPLDLVKSLVCQSIFNDRALTAIGLGEFLQMRWDGAGLAQKRDVIGHADFVLTAAPSLEKYAEQRQRLQNDCVNDRLFDASDAHYFASSKEAMRLGACRTWIKADLTFEGLRRAITRFDDRVFVGDVPPKVERVQRKRTHYIRSVDIHPKEEPQPQDKWFDVSLELSHDLVAVIGNQGSGKSALADILALCGASRAENFSFLTPTRFCDKEGRARAFKTTVTWEDGKTSSVTLDARVAEEAIERVRYVPQGFFDTVTNEKEVALGGGFYGEITKAVFSHIPPSDRLGAVTFGQLIDLQTNAIDAECERLRRQLAELNARIIKLEAATSATAVSKVKAELEARVGEIEALKASPPEVVLPPKGVSGAMEEIEALRTAEDLLREQLARRETKRSSVKNQRAALTQAVSSLRTAERQLAASIANVDRDLRAVGMAVNLSAAIRVTLDEAPLASLIDTANRSLSEIDQDLDASRKGSVAEQLAVTSDSRAKKERALEAAAGSYQGYLTRKAEWERQLVELEGREEHPDPKSLRGLTATLAELTDEVPLQLNALREERRLVCAQIFETRAGIGDIYQALTAPVQAHIASEALTRDKYQISFEVALNEVGLTEAFFACVNHVGSFQGVQAGQERLRKLIAGANFSSAAGAVAFAETLLDNLHRNHRVDPPKPTEMASSLSKGTQVQEVYDLVFSLDYIKPQFALALGGKPLHRLSPGERGILLLVFYLVVDCSEEPLIIDQPEGNLNNQSIVDQLVPVFMAAKERRQIILVTHNPNLAVVCDAEQVVHCAIDVADGNAVHYESGSLENPKFNQLSLDLLEGTARAFSLRHNTYESLNSRSSH